MLLDYPGGVEQIFQYSGKSTRELKACIARHRVSNINLLPGFPRILEAIDKAVANGAHLKYISESTILFDFSSINVNGYGSSSIQMISLSPSAESEEQYFTILAQSMPQVGQIVKPLKDAAHNLISSAVLLRAGDIQILFGSDLEVGPNDRVGWSCLMSNRFMPELWCNLIKVAHHGSSNAFLQAAWEVHGKKTKPYAVISPFIYAKTTLPEPSMIEILRNYSNRLGITAFPSSTDALYSVYSRDIARAVKHATRSFKIVKEESGIGFLRVRMDLKGRITEQHAQLPAKWL